MFTCFEAGKESFRSRLSLCHFRDVSLINFYVEQWSSARENVSETAHHLKVRFQWPASSLVTEMNKAGCARESAALHVAWLVVPTCINWIKPPFLHPARRCVLLCAKWVVQREEEKRCQSDSTARRVHGESLMATGNVMPSHCGCAS